MSLQPKGATQTIERQDRHEFATGQFFQNIYSSIPVDQKRAFGVATMRRVRQQWGKDFSREGFSINDFKRLGELLPAGVAFDAARAQLSDENYIKQVIAESRDKYNQYQARKLYPISILDPQLQAVPAMADVRKMICVTRDRSLRSIKPGEDMTIYSVKGDILHEARPQSVQQPSNFVTLNDASENNKVEDENEEEVDTSGGVFGWTSTKDTTGLDRILGAYFSKADQDILAKRFGSGNSGVFFSEDDLEGVYNAQHLLRYMRSNGLNFNIKDRNENPLDKRIEVRLELNNFEVRVFDKSPAYIGRVYDGFGHYYLSTMSRQDQSSNMEWSNDDTTAVLEVLTGKRGGTVHKTVSNANSHIRGFDRNSPKKVIQAKIIPNRYDSLVYKDAEEAEAYLRDAIVGADAYFTQEFKSEALIDALLDSDSDREPLLSQDEVVRERQEALLHDAALLSDLKQIGMLDTAETLVRSVPFKQLDEARISGDIQETGRYLAEVIHAESVGSYDNGFNPSFVVEHAPEDPVRKHERNAMMGALRTTEYPLDKLKGNDFATQSMMDSLVTFNPETGRQIDDIDDPFLKRTTIHVQEKLIDLGFVGPDGKGAPQVMLDDQGIIEWQGHRQVVNSAKRGVLKSNGKNYDATLLKGEIGQIFAPDEKGIIKTNFGSGENYGVVPGYTGYFQFDGEYTENRMDNFRVKGFEQHLYEKIDTQLIHQSMRPVKMSWDNIPNLMDGSGLNGLYHGDVYGRRIELDFADASSLKPEVTDAILTTLRNRIRLDNQYSDHATTSAETRANMDTSHEDQGAFSYWKAVGEKNLRVLDDDLANIVDLTMTGTGKTQGLVWYLVDGAKVNADGSVRPSSGDMQLDGSILPDKTAIKKLEYFDKEVFNAWDRVQMSANQLMTAVHVDEGVGTALMSFGGWTFDDSYAVSKEFADRNKVMGNKPTDDSMSKLDDLVRYAKDFPDKYDKDAILSDSGGMRWSDDVIEKGVALAEQALSDDRTVRQEARIAYQSFLEEHGRFRPLTRGDKISDFGGNKGTIGIVIDRNMSPEDAKALQLEREVAIMKANPGLDVVGAPYSMLSRHNAGVVKELMQDGASDIVDPTTGEVLHGALGKLNLIVTDLTVDEKTHAYSDADVADGKGRKASGQLAWALQSKDASGIMSEIYGNNIGPWETLREYLIVTGLDMDVDGTLRVGYDAQNSGLETRNELDPADYESSADFLNQISDKGGFLNIPFELEFKTGNKTDKIPVLSSALRKNTEMVDGRMRRSDFNNHYAALYDAVKTYIVNSEITEFKDEKHQEDVLSKIEGAKTTAQTAFDRIQNEVIDRQFDGGHNGKHSFIRDKIMGRRMNKSATGVAVVDPRLEIGEAAMNAEMRAALDVKEGDTVMAWRDPVWRDGAIRKFTVVADETVHGIGINPIADKSHDMDFDGDTMGIIKLETPAALRDLDTKFSHEANMIDLGSGKNDLYFQSGMDLASAEAKALELGDTSLVSLKESAHKNALSDNPKLVKKSLNDLSKYAIKAFREYSFGAAHVDLTSPETQADSFKKMVESGAKGSPKKLAEYMQYFNGEKTREDAKMIQYATGIKTDDTGLAGAFSQKAVSVMRNNGIKAALELTYPITQGTLQIKHDAKHALVVNDVLTGPMANLYNGKSADGKQENITTNAWKRQMKDVLENRLEVSYNPEYLDTIAEELSTNNIVNGLKDVMLKKGSPMDQVAYGGGYEALKRLAKDGRSLLEGEKSQEFAPFDMRFQRTNVLAKSDTRDLASEAADAAALEAGLARYEKTLDTPKMKQSVAVVDQSDALEL